MGTFDVNSSEFGRSDIGKREEIARMNRVLDNYKKIVLGEKYKRIISTVNANWSGEDATAYIKSIQNKAEELCKKLDHYKKVYETVLNEDSNEFSKVTKKNASVINNIR